MERDNYNDGFHSNHHRYEQHLSPFGRKVLNSLVRNWKADQNNCKKNAFQHNLSVHRNRRVLTFINETSLRQSQPINTEENSTELEYNELINNLIEQNNRKNIAHAPTANEMVQTLQTTNNTEFKFNETNDLVNPITNGVTNIDSDINYCTSTVDLINCKGQTQNEDYDDKVVDIEWDNMFDSELLSDEIITNPQLVLKPVQNTFNIQFSNGNEKQLIVKVSKETIKAKPKKSKSKTINKDSLPKKAKKVCEEAKPNLRKQTYKKAVKNWLADTAKSYQESDKINDTVQTNTIGQTEVILEKVKGKSKKKEVQAQLANKGGIMKFDKPRDKNDKNDVNKINELDKASDEDTVKNNKAIKNKLEKECKEKKNKLKFVAPIKSQIPVKDVEFKVIILDGNHNRDNIDSIQSIKNQDLVAVLVYSNGFCQLNNQHTEDLCDPDGILISVDDKSYFFKGHHETINKELLEHLVEDNKITCYEGKSLLIYFKSIFDLDIYNIDVIDAKIGGSLINPDSPPENFSDFQKLLNITPEYTIATECKLQKTAWYGSLLKECRARLVTLLKEEQLWHVFVEIEMKLLPIIAEMERLGVTVDTQKLKSMEDILLKKMKATEVECHKAAGKPFQINSPVQVRAIIYDELQLDTKSNIKIRETLAKGAKSTSETMLRSLVSMHPLPKLILEYRHVHKAHATFLAGIAQFVRNGVVKPTWVQTAAATGRIASNNPNLQAIPKAPFNLVMFPEDNQNACGEPLQFRSVYVSREGHTLLAADFQHIECRVFAHAAADERLLNALKSGRDLFRVLAAEWLQKAEQEVSPADRERTKRIVYASMYGAGCNKLMDILGVTYQQARDVMASFHRTFPSLKSFGRSVVLRCSNNGGRVSTLCGRARVLHNITSEDTALRAQAERQAVNFIVQGSAADLCKSAMVQCVSALRMRNVSARLLVQIHDELVWELNDQSLHTAASIIKQVMEECGVECGLTTTLPVSLAVGKSWGDMTPYNL